MFELSSKFKYSWVEQLHCSARASRVLLWRDNTFPALCEILNVFGESLTILLHLACPRYWLSTWHLSSPPFCVMDSTICRKFLTSIFFCAIIRIGATVYRRRFIIFKSRTSRVSACCNLKQTDRGLNWNRTLAARGQILTSGVFSLTISRLLFQILL